MDTEGQDSDLSPERRGVEMGSPLERHKQGILKTFIFYFRSLPLLSVLFHAFINHICLFLVCFPFVCRFPGLATGKAK